MIFVKFDDFKFISSFALRHSLLKCDNRNFQFKNIIYLKWNKISISNDYLSRNAISMKIMMIFHGENSDFKETQAVYALVTNLKA